MRCQDVARGMLLSYFLSVGYDACVIKCLSFGDGLAGTKCRIADPIGTLRANQVTVEQIAVLSNVRHGVSAKSCNFKSDTKVFDAKHSAHPRALAFAGSSAQLPSSGARGVFLRAARLNTRPKVQRSSRTVR